jgi:hypothetical protein
MQLLIDGRNYFVAHEQTIFLNEAASLPGRLP